MHRIGGLILVLVGVGTLLVTGQVGASNFDTNMYADNRNHYYAYVSLETSSVVAANWGRDRIDATDMNTHNDGTCKTHTDVCIFDGAYVGGIWDVTAGLVSCQTWVGAGRCDKFRMHLNTSILDTASTQLLRRVGCHEWGHTGGLDHVPASWTGWTCMWASLDAPRQSAYFGWHDIAHLNAEY